jgi:hypothetical protein
MTREIVERAIETLDGVIQIARHEQLRQGTYLTGKVVNHKLAKEGAICGGHQACFIGSLWLGAGVKMRQDRRGDSYLPKTDQNKRRYAWLSRPHLKLALDAADRAAEQYAERHQLTIPGRYSSSAEALFERGLRGATPEEIRDHVIRVCNNAKRQLRREHAEVLA